MVDLVYNGEAQVEEKVCETNSEYSEGVQDIKS